MQQMQGQAGQPDTAGAMNDQLMQVPPDAYVDPRMGQMPQAQPGLMSQFPDVLREPLVIFVLVLFFACPTITVWLAQYIPQLAGEAGKPTWGSVIVLALLVTGFFALIKKFVLKM